MDKINFKLVTPERVVLREQADSITCPTTTGQITVLPEHIPLISSLAHGELTVKINGKQEYYAVSGGFVEVRPGSEVVILADTAEHATEIDEEAAQEAHTRAKEAMKNASKMTAEEYTKIQVALERSLARLRVAKRNPHRGQHGLGSTGILRE